MWGKGAWLYVEVDTHEVPAGSTLGFPTNSFEQQRSIIREKDLDQQTASFLFFFGGLDFIISQRTHQPFGATPYNGIQDKTLNPNPKMFYTNKNSTPMDDNGIFMLSKATTESEIR